MSDPTHESLARGLAEAHLGQAVVRDDLLSVPLAEALGEVLDRHVGWKMHRGAMSEELAKAVAEHLTSEPALAAFREAWLEADAEGAKGDRVRRGMAAAIKAVS